MVRYKLIKDIMRNQVTTIYDRQENFYFPITENNRMYREYLAWLEQGNEPEPADEAPE